MWTGEQIKQKYQNSYHLKTKSQNNQQKISIYQDYISIFTRNMKFLSLSMWAECKAKYHRICHLKTTSQNDTSSPCTANLAISLTITSHSNFNFSILAEGGGTSPIGHLTSSILHRKTNQHMC